MTGSEMQKIIESMSDDMKDVLMNGLNDSIEAMCYIADYMRKNFVPVSVIEDIKADIKEVGYCKDEYGDIRADVLTVGQVIKIIDKRTSRSKMEG